MKIKKLWGKRLAKEPAAIAEVFTSGRDVRGMAPADERLVSYDIWGSRAHVLMLARKEILPKPVARVLVKGLGEIENAWEKGKFFLDPSEEDVHSNVESWLIKKFGLKVGGRLHTARSRNDQIALDMRLYLRDRVLDDPDVVLKIEIPDGDSLGPRHVVRDAPGHKAAKNRLPVPVVEIQKEPHVLSLHPSIPLPYV